PTSDPRPGRTLGRGSCRPRESVWLSGSCSPGWGRGSLVAVDDAALGPVRGADLQEHAVVLDDADVVLGHPSRHPRQDFVPVGEDHGVEAVPAQPGDGSLGLDEVSSWHLVILLVALAAASHSGPRERALVLPRPGF